MADVPGRPRTPGRPPHARRGPREARIPAGATLACALLFCRVVPDQLLERRGRSRGGKPQSSAVLSDRAEADSALAAALIEGRPEAPRQAWTQLEPLVWWTLARRYPSLAFCHQDLRQEVFLRLFARIRELRDRRALRRFVIGICMGVAQNELRRATHRRIEIPIDRHEGEGPGREAPVEARQAIAGLDLVLARSNAQDRALFVARHVEKRGVEEIAARAGWTVGSTKRRLARATERVGLRLRREPTLADYAADLPAA